jgi:NADPH:quinone reductase-like Zn-dependent oxidoreductase
VLAACATRIDPADPLSALELRQVPDPEPRDGWEVVEVRAASLNHHDLWTLRGVGVDPDGLPQVLGTDAAGVTSGGRAVIVHAVLGTAGPGEDETLAPDFHLLSERGVPGTIAERVAVPRRNLIPKPAALTFAEAACLPTCYLTAYRALFSRARLNPGDRVLVQGAGGGVSTAAIVLARAAGITVYVTSRSPEKRAQAMELGAALAVEPGARLPERVDAVVETIGRATWGHSLRSVRTGGTIVVSGATTGSDPPAELNRVFWRGLTVMGSSMGTVGELGRLCAFMEGADVRPIVDSQWPMEQAPSAFARLEGGQAFGKVVVTRAGPPAAEEAVAWAEAALAETSVVSRPLR